MSEIPIYLGYPNSRLNPVMPEWLQEVSAILNGSLDWEGWALKCLEYDMSCSLQINDVFSIVNENIGPVVLIRPVQEKVFTALRQKLYGRAVVLVETANDAAELLNKIENGRVLHLDGEPMLPRKLVIALLLVAKLERHQMWGGKNKGYMWARDLAKGRGVDEKFRDQLPSVINDLSSHNLLIKKLSNGKNKFALNPETRNEIYNTLRSCVFRNDLHAIFMRDKRVESARNLDAIRGA